MSEEIDASPDSMQALVITEYRKVYENPIAVRKGERLEVGDFDADSPEWYWCVGLSGKSGWTHQSVFERIDGGWIAMRDYDATELSVAQGERVRISDSLGGWSWCTNDKKRSGWVPQENLEVSGPK